MADLTHTSQVERKQLKTVGHSPLHPAIALICFTAILPVHNLVGIFLAALLIMTALYLCLRAGQLDQLPEGLADQAARSVQRFQTFYPETLLLLAALYIPFAEQLPIPFAPNPTDLQVDNWQRICASGLLVLNYWCNTIPEFCFRRKNEEQGEEDTREEMPVLDPPMPEDREVSRLNASKPSEQAASAAVIQAHTPASDRWRQQQEQRWTAWIDEEVQRLGS